MEQNKYIPGDWVKHRGKLARIEETYRTNYFVKECHNDYNPDIEYDDAYFFREVRPQDLVPIPITPEILAKNGWKKAFPNENLWKNGDIIIYDCLLKDNSWCFKVTGFEGGNIYFKFVHQLQHLLFGLGLDSNFYLTDTKEGVSV